MLRTAAGAAANMVRGAAGAVPLPRVLTWTLTFRCNARCGMCDSWRKGGEEAGEEDALRLVERIPRSVAVVRLTGGEPFLRADIGEIARALDDRIRPEMTHVTTNGFLRDRITGFLDDRARRTSAPIHLLVSLDGTGSLHDDVRGCQGAFARTVATLREVAANRRRWNVRLAVNQTVVDRRGIEGYADLHALLREMDVPHHVVVAYAESATYSAESGRILSPGSEGDYRTAGDFSAAEMDAFLAVLERDAGELPASNRIAKRYYLEGIRSRLLRGKGDPSPRCQALGGHLRIFPDGSVPVCQFNGTIAGNLLREEFGTLWNRSATAGHRRWVAACPGCWAECEVLPSAALGGDLLGRALGARRRA